MKAANTKRVRRTVRITSAIALLMLTIAGTAVAGTRPAVTTGGTKDVTYGSAILAGTINPEAANTSYYFQYGPTKAYGSQTGIADAGSGTSTVPVALGITGLQPITIYHYRLVAVNATGVTLGSDRSFTTPKIPLSLAILASPNPVVFGGPVVVQGTLSGTGGGNRAVVLQGEVFPFSAGFQNLGNPELTSASGGFSFTMLGASLVTRYRVVTVGTPSIISPVTTENVAVEVTSHLAKAKRKGRVRVYGSVTPAEAGAQVGVLRVVRGRGVLVGGTSLKAAATAKSSSFSLTVPSHKGVYRVLIRIITPTGQVSNYGTPLVIR